MMVLFDQSITRGPGNMDNDARELIPSPGVVRERLARNYEDADLLRRLLKLAVVAAERNQQRQRSTPPYRATTNEEVGRD
jgi:hypothetical protein